MSKALEVTQEWSEDHLPSVFIRWHDYSEKLFRGTAAAIIEAASIAPGMRVIDIGSGSGVPALDIAQKVGSHGRVLATDPAPLFIEAIQQFAAKRGISNLDVAVAPVTSLPVAAGSMDAATAHLAAMHFPDIDASFRSVRRTLEPGARFAVLVWGQPDRNPFFSIVRETAAAFIPPDPITPPPAPDQPGPLRFAEPGRIARELEAAGFKSVTEVTRTIELVWPGPPTSICNNFLEMSRFGEKLDDTQLREFEEQVAAAYEPYRDGDDLHFEVNFNIGVGRA